MGILVMVFINVVITYMDRSNISIAANAISKDLHLSTVELGLIFSAFGWTYTFLQIPGGILADRVKPRILYAFNLIIWSIATLLQAFAFRFSTLFGLRMAIGVFEAPSFPMNNRIVTSWFPTHERASAIAFYTSGQYAGLAVLTPVLVTIQHFYGWQGLFIISGLAGILWGVVWYLFYRDPADHRRVNEAELQYIEDGGGSGHTDAGHPLREPLTLSQLKQVFRSRKLWGIYLGQFCLGATHWFFLTWFPTYLVKFRGLDFLSSGYLGSLPFIAAGAGVLISGFFSDYLVRRGVAVGYARKLPVILGLCLTSSIIFANYVQDPGWIIFFMALSFFGNGLASIAWIFVSLLAPKNLLGLTGGVFNFLGGLSSIVIPLAIGILASGGNFQPALIFVSTLGLIGAASYIFLVGKIN